MRDYLDDFVCRPTCEEYYDDGWADFDDDFDYLVQRNQEVQNMIDLEGWSNW